MTYNTDMPLSDLRAEAAKRITEGREGWTHVQPTWWRWEHAQSLVASLNADWAITKQNPLPGGRTKAKAPTPPPVPKPTPLIDIIIDEPTAIEQGTEPEPPAPNTGLEQLGAILGPIMQPYIKQQKVDISALKEQMDQRLQEIDERIKERIDNLQPVEKIIMVDREKAKRIDVGRQHRQYEEVCEIMLSLRKRKQNVLLIGPAGSGKSQCAHQFAKGIGGDFWLQSCGPGTQEFHFWGHTTATGDYMPTPTWNAFQPSDKPRVLCIDEIDSSSPDVGLVLNAITNGDDACFPHPVGCLPRPEDLFIFATGNTFNGADQKFVGRYEMDGALRDRFVVIKFGHDLAFEEVLYPEFPEWRKYVQACREAVDSLRLSYVVSSRAIQKGTDLLASGRLGKPRIEEVCLWGDGALPAEDVRRVREKVKADVGLVWA